MTGIKKKDSYINPAQHNNTKGVMMTEQKKKKKGFAGMNLTFGDMQSAMSGNSVDLNR